MAYNEVLTSLVVAGNGIDNWTLGEIANRWNEIDTCRLIRMLWPLKSHKKTLTLLSFDKWR